MCSCLFSISIFEVPFAVYVLRPLHALLADSKPAPGHQVSKNTSVAADALAVASQDLMVSLLNVTATFPLSIFRRSYGQNDVRIHRIKINKFILCTGHIV